MVYPPLIAIVPVVSARSQHLARALGRPAKTTGSTGPFRPPRASGALAARWRVSSGVRSRAAPTSTEALATTHNTGKLGSGMMPRGWSIPYRFSPSESRWSRSRGTPRDDARQRRRRPAVRVAAVVAGRSGPSAPGRLARPSNAARGRTCCGDRARSSTGTRACSATPASTSHPDRWKPRSMIHRSSELVIPSPAASSKSGTRSSPATDTTATRPKRSRRWSTGRRRRPRCAPCWRPSTSTTPLPSGCSSAVGGFVRIGTCRAGDGAVEDVFRRDL